jgi:hypothetical protein
MKHRLLIVLTALAVAMTTLLSVSTDASASAEGCTWAPSGGVCNYTYGSGARVDEINAIRDRVNNQLICNYSADASVEDAYGRVVWFQHQSHTGCTPARAYFRFYPKRTFVCGYVTAVAWYESGVQQGGYANVNLCG